MGRTKRKWNKRVKSRPISKVSEKPTSQDSRVEDCTSGINLEAFQSLDMRLVRDSGALRAQIDDYAEKIQGMVLNLTGLLQKLQALKEEESTNNRNVNSKITHSLEENPKLDRRDSISRTGLTPLISQGNSNILNSIMFERYDGTKDFNVIHDWLYAFEAYWKMIPIPEEDEVKFAVFHLRGPAAIIWCKHTARAQQGHETMISNWEQFRNWTMHTFLPYNYVHQTRTEWRNLRQNNNTVQQYVEQFENCLLKVPDIVDESEQVHHFLIGLRRDIRQELKGATKSATLGDAIFQAEIIEEKLQGKKNSTSQEEKNLRSKKKSKELNTLDYLTLMCTPKQVQFKWLTDKEKDEYRKLGMCYVCKKPGHTTFKCPEKVERQQRSNAIKSQSYQEIVEEIDNMKSVQESKNTLDEEKGYTESISEYDLIRMRYGILIVRQGH